jgi:hypothetical protein
MVGERRALQEGGFELLERAVLDLAHALLGDAELVAELLQRPRIVAQAALQSTPGRSAWSATRTVLPPKSTLSPSTGRLIGSLQS